MYYVFIFNENGGIFDNSDERFEKFSKDFITKFNIRVDIYCILNHSNFLPAHFYMNNPLFTDIGIQKNIYEFLYDNYPRLSFKMLKSISKQKALE